MFVKQAGYCAENRGRTAVTLSIGEKFFLPAGVNISHWTSFLLTSGIVNNAGMNILITKMYTSF